MFGVGVGCWLLGWLTKGSLAVWLLWGCVWCGVVIWFLGWLVLGGLTCGWVLAVVDCVVEVV